MISGVLPEEFGEERSIYGSWAPDTFFSCKFEPEILQYFLWLWSSSCLHAMWDIQRSEVKKEGKQLTCGIWAGSQRRWHSFQPDSWCHHLWRPARSSASFSSSARFWTACTPPHSAYEPEYFVRTNPIHTIERDFAYLFSTFLLIFWRSSASWDRDVYHHFDAWKWGASLDRIIVPLSWQMCSK